MKSLFYTLVLLVFSAIILTPLKPKPYPPPAVVEQRLEIAQKEQQLEVLIKKIEYNIAIDSLKICYIKENHE
jgi:hypothetical protein